MTQAIAHHLLAAGADQRQPRRLLAQAPPYRVLALGRGLAPQVIGGAEFGLAIVEPQVDGRLGLAVTTTAS